MSAYISRMIQRFVPIGEPPVAGGPVADAPVASALLNPFVRSQSPIAAIDQRLSVSERLGHGLGGLDSPIEEVPESVTPITPSAPRIQRKVAAPLVPSLRSDHSISAPEPANGSATAIPAGSRPDSPQPDSSRPTPVAERPHDKVSAPLDPGPLFGPAPRYFDELPAPRPLAPASPGQSAPALTPSPITSARAREATSVLESSIEPPTNASLPTAPAPETISQLRPLPPTQTIENHFAWLYTESSSAAPQLEQFPPTVAREPHPTPLLYIVPRPRAPEPLIAEAIEPAHVEAPQPPPKRASPPTTRQAHGAAPTPSRQPPRQPPTGKLTIDSISQIGPLDRHFPNRRDFRLRYR